MKLKKIVVTTAVMAVILALGSCKKQEASTASVTFDAYGGSFVQYGSKSCIDTTVNVGSVVSQPESPFRLGYTLVGWCTDASLQKAYDFAAPVEGDLYLFANWQEIVVEVENQGVSEIYNINGDSKYLY